MLVIVGAQKVSESRGEGKAQTEDAKGREEAYQEENKGLIDNYGHSIGFLIDMILLQPPSSINIEF